MKRRAVFWALLGAIGGNVFTGVVLMGGTRKIAPFGRPPMNPHADQFINDATWATLKKHYNTKQMLEVPLRLS